MRLPRARTSGVRVIVLMRAGAAWSGVRVGRALQRIWREFRASILLYPTIMTLGALLLFAVTSLLDIRYAALFSAFEVAGHWWGFLLFAGSADSAARVLAALTSTWATIVGVVYSVTLVTIQLSATKYSAQVIPVFERDRLNQVTLGAFTATFAYSLLVLKTVRGGDASFVPIIGTNIAIVFALTSLALLLAFIGNLTAYIRPTRFVEDYAQGGKRELYRLVQPSHIEGYEPAGSEEARDVEDDPDCVRVKPDATGYITAIDWEGLRRVIRDAGLERVDVRVALGDHVSEHETLARVWPRAEEVDEDALCERLLPLFTLDKRPDESDPDRIAETLADISVTGMSGGATDVGVAKVALRALLDLTAAGLAQEDPGPSFEVAGADDRRAKVTRRREAFHDKAYREVARVTTKARREAYWDLGEHFALHVGAVLREAARQDEDTWQETISWLELSMRDVLACDDVRLRSRVGRRFASHLRHLRAGDRPERAVDVEHALMDAARHAGVVDEVRRTLEAAHADA